jgi:hypothetical protein
MKVIGSSIVHKSEATAAHDPGGLRGWLDRLSDEDVMFLKRFVLASGSLKGLAGVYGISYPTVRLRLDRLIQKIEILDDQQVASAFERRVRLLHAEGRIELDTLKLLLEEHRREVQQVEDAQSESRR